MNTTGKSARSIRDTVLIGMFTAILAVLSILQIPMPSGVPVTLQTFAVALIGFMLGMKKGFLTTFLYLMIGAAGLPVFSGMKGGFGVLTGPTGGFIVGFLGMAALCGFGMSRRPKKAAILFGVLGLALCHACGVLWFAWLMKQGLAAACLTVSVPYLLKDLISIVGAWLVAQLLRERLYALGICFF